MKTCKLQKLAWVFFALALTTTTVYSQGYRNEIRNFKNQNSTCLEQISDLTEEQKSTIQELENIHKQEMAELRAQRRSTIDAIEKNEIRGTMLKNVKSHQTAVKNLLLEEQQKQYDNIHLNSNLNYEGGKQPYNSRAGNNQACARGNGNYATLNNNGCQQGRANRQRNLRNAGCGKGYGRNTAVERGYGRRFNTVPTDTNEDSKEN